MDGTITESRQMITPEMKFFMSKLPKFVVVSGAEKKRMKKQLDGLDCILMAQNGNDTPDWQNKLSKQEKQEVYEHLKKVEKWLDMPVLNDETVHDRGCQISFSFTGHNADINWKKKFDPKKKYRNMVLQQVPFKSKTLMVRVAGTTCFDYNKKGFLKGDNIKRYMKLHKLKKNDCIYYGDNFDKGGNDESVLGVMKCVRVKSPEDLIKKL